MKYESKFAILLTGLLAAALLTGAGAALADKGHGKESAVKMKDGHAMAMGCDRDLHFSMEAEKQLGGSMYKGPMPKTASMGGMKMKGGEKGMKMEGKSMAGGKTKGMAGAHEDHAEKMGGVFFMAPNEIHHIEGAYSEKCGFQLFLYNAFTKPIRVGRFQALIKVIGEAEGEDVEVMRFLSPNREDSILQAPIGHGIKAPFEIELYVKFPEGEEVEVFNFAVDEHGNMS